MKDFKQKEKTIGQKYQQRVKARLVMSVIQGGRRESICGLIVGRMFAYRLGSVPRPSRSVKLGVQEFWASVASSVRIRGLLVGVMRIVRWRLMDIGNRVSPVTLDFVFGFEHSISS